MSILIKGLEMPNACTDCIFIQRGFPDWCDLPDGHDIYNDKIRQEWCPLVEVPTPHGRLIDADAYCNEMGKRQEAAHKWMYEATINANDEGYDRAEATCCAFIEAKLTLDKMPTIIEAEE